MQESVVEFPSGSGETKGGLSVYLSCLRQVFFCVWECKKEILQSCLLCKGQVWNAGKRIRNIVEKVVAFFQILREYTTTKKIWRSAYGEVAIK